jgi:hypothetical protein
MRPIVFLASYPRSGNTFLRALLGNYESNLGRPLSVDEIAGYGFGEKSEAVWRDCTGMEPPTRSMRSEWLARPAYLRASRRLPGEGALSFKTHTLNGSILGAPAFNIRKIDRAVYIVRHPFDVALSCAPFFGLSLEAIAERMLLAGAFNVTDGRAPFEVTGSWLQHVTGWINEKRCPLLVVRYRDLRLDTPAQLTRILRFMGKSVQPDRIARAVAFSAFDQLQRSHAEGGFDQGPDRDRKATFFRVGEQDQWKERLPAPLIGKLAAELGPLMDQLGFERPLAGRRGAVRLSPPPFR